VLERDGGGLKVMRTDHFPLALQLLAQGTRDGGGFVIEWHRGMAVEDRFEFGEPGG